MKSAILVMSFTLVASSARATSFQVTLDTSSLSGPQTIGFALTDFDPASNLVSLSAFDFDSGAAVAGSEDCTFGGTISGAGCAGTLSTGVTLEDVDTFTFFTQLFNPGSTLSFVLNSTNDFSGGAPDEFGLFVCDGGFVSCYSDDASGTMLLLQLSGGILSTASFTTFGASLQGLDAPIVTELGSQAPQVPEPATLTLLTVGLGMTIARRFRQVRSIL